MSAPVSQEVKMITLDADTINSWADKKDGPVDYTDEDDVAIIFPPTYADIGYNIDTLSDGTKIATIDSVGSQANRLEPIFKSAPYANLVPQIEIQLHTDENHSERRSLLDLAHRSADAVVMASPKLAAPIASAFKALRQRRNAMPLCSIAPTSLLFGAWDSRGGSNEKLPRLVRSTIRAWGVDLLSSAAQFNSIWKTLSEEQKKDLKKEAKTKKVDLSEKGFADAPATFRKLGKSAGSAVPEFRDGAPNPHRRVLGGILVRDRIEREVTINLTALRNLFGADEQETQRLRRYLLGLALIAGTADMDLFLRAGCHLRVPDEKDLWSVVPRRGPIKEQFELSPAQATETLQSYTERELGQIKEHWPKDQVFEFDLSEAKRLLAKKEDEDGDEG